MKPDCSQIATADQIASIQWSRWGRRGVAMLNQISPDLMPDYMEPDGMVDEVTNLFGLASPDRDSTVEAYAARVRPENLVFYDAACRLEMVTLAPLQPPHPGCVAFYRDSSDPATVGASDQMRGYKVYRTTSERGVNAPWQFATQGVYGDKGELLGARQSVNKTVELLQEGTCGTLRIAVRALSRRELALLLLACELPWRLGGGKPLGLGLCRVNLVRLVDEFGATVAIDTLGWQTQVADIQQRAQWWRKSQQPVARLRYPRAVGRNNNRVSRGGHVWYQQHASPIKTPDGKVMRGLQSHRLDGPARARAGEPVVPAQVLPSFDPMDPLADVLYGYDMVVTDSGQLRNRETVIHEIVPFDPNRLTGTEHSGGNTSQNRQTRQDERSGRLAEPAPAPPPVAVPPPATLKKGETVKCVVCADPKGKERTFALHEPSGRVGSIQNSGDMPDELKKVGASVSLRVKIYDKTQLQFIWIQSTATK
jgi:hypothetical protein